MLWYNDNDRSSEGLHHTPSVTGWDVRDNYSVNIKETGVTNSNKDSGTRSYTNCKNRTVLPIQPSSTRVCNAEGSTTQISGWKDPFEIDTRRTRNMLSMCMKPWPILQRSSTDPPGMILCRVLVSHHGISHRDVNLRSCRRDTS